MTVGVGGPHLRAAVVLLLALTACGPADPELGPGGDKEPAVRSEDGYVGRAVCEDCHDRETEAYLGSHHDLAMQVAGPATMLGDFAADHAGGDGTTTFSRDGERYMVRTHGAGGAQVDVEAAYTFGVTPLQQLLVRGPRGRLQAFGVAWDARPRVDGGQRWFDLYPDDPPRPGEPLHWSGTDQTWNHMCAECHSTGLKKGYDADTDTYTTTWNEVDVSCEACHGPGGRHVAWGRKVQESGDDDWDEAEGLVVDLRNRAAVEWKIDPETGNAYPRRDAPGNQVETCGRCHSRRLELTDEYDHGSPLFDTHVVALLDEGLYFPDGQIRDEVFVYGSFVQSRMFGAGVSCTDCHDAHTARLLATGNALCVRCHDAKRFDAKVHHFHEPGTEGAQCVACHMPQRTYMVVDPRADHSLRVPRPDVAVRTGSPDVCTGCHEDKQPEWAAERVIEWYGRKRTDMPHYGDAIHAGRTGAPGARAALRRLIGDDSAPGIARGTAISLLGSLGSRSLPGIVESAAADEDAFVRLGAARALVNLPPRLRVEAGTALLADRVRAVRHEAAQHFAGPVSQDLAAMVRPALDRALGERRAALRFEADRAQGWTGLADLEWSLENTVAAEKAYRRALRQDPSFVPAAVNLADRLRALDRDPDAERVLREALAVQPDDADLLHAYGLALVRARQLRLALDALEKASRLRPGNARYAVVHAVALLDTDSSDAALAVLETAVATNPNDPQLLRTLTQVLQARGDPAAAEYAERLRAVIAD